MHLSALIKLPKKLFLIFAWFSLATFTLLSSSFLLLSLNASNSKNFLTQLAPSAYQLFAALPRQGTVLGATIVGKDGREEQLTSFLQRYNSPLTPSAATFIKIADKYNLPWTLLPAIAGKESGFGKVIPINSYNAWGWGIHTGQNSGISFSSWEEGIEKVAAGIKKDYFNKGLDTPSKMEPKYTPPSAASHHSWLQGVEFFMDQLENWQ